MPYLAQYTAEEVAEAFQRLAAIAGRGEVVMDLPTYEATVKDVEVAMLFARALKTECDRVRVPSRLRLHREAMEFQTEPLQA